MSPNGELIVCQRPGIPGDKHDQARIRARAMPVNAWLCPLRWRADCAHRHGEPPHSNLWKRLPPYRHNPLEYGDLEIRQTTLLRTLDRLDYQSGPESTLAWAVFEVTNHGKTGQSADARCSSQMGDEKNLKTRPDLCWQRGHGERQRPVFSAGSGGVRGGIPSRLPRTAEAQRRPTRWDSCGAMLAVFNALAVQGRIGAGQTVRIVFNRRLDFPGTLHWGPSPQSPVAPEDLT